MYVARERKSVSPSLRLYTKKPVRDFKYNPSGLWVSDGDSIPLPPELFPDLRWEDEPLEVDITLIPKFNCLPGIFTVNANGKKVKFSPGNLFWDGNGFAFEKHQYDYPTEWNPNHVGHFFWSKDASVAVASSYSDGSAKTTDKFFAADGGAIEEYTVLSNDEWRYLIDNALVIKSNKPKVVTIAGKKCVILKPDGFSGEVADIFSAEEWKQAEVSGLVALPFAGYRNGSSFYGAGSYCYCWSSVPLDSRDAYCALFNSNYACTYDDYRNVGFSVRLVSVQ